MTVTGSDLSIVEPAVLVRANGKVGGRDRSTSSDFALNVAASAVIHFNREDPPANGPIDVVDLFCGAGGLSCGFEAFGRMRDSFQIRSAVDLDPWSCRTYAANLPVAPFVQDLAVAASSAQATRKFVSSLRLRSGHPLVLIGGPPCQGFSAHRKKDAVQDDPRNNLIQVFATLLIALQPSIAVLENVPELLAKKHWRKFEDFKRTLASAGYNVRAQIHNLAGYGVPQERFRALVIASRGPIKLPQPFLTPASFRTVRQAIGELPSITPGQPNTLDPMHVCTGHRPETIAVMRRVPKDGGRRPFGVGPKCLDEVDGFRDVYGRMYWDRPANTVTAYARNPASGRYVHPNQDRGLSIREAALLQSFPRGWIFDGPFDHRFLQIGNAVPPAFAAALAAHLFAQLTDPSQDLDPSADCDVVGPTSNSFSSGIAGRKRRVSN